MPTEKLETVTVDTGGVELVCLTAGGEGPLALCLHGFPDTAHGFRHLLPALAGAGYRAVAPFMRGYAPSPVPADGRYQTGALVRDAVGLHESLGGGSDAVLIGHDWGALAAYGAASFAPDRWRRVVTAAVPPPAAMATAMTTYDQLKRSWYMFFFQVALADVVVAMDDLAFIERLWADWSPGHDGSEDVAHVKDALRDPAHLEAALGYYRTTWGNLPVDPDLRAEQDATASAPPQPLLYLHGERDGCVGVEFARGAEAGLAEGSRVEIVADAGHFLLVERPTTVNDLILSFLAGA